MLHTPTSQPLFIRRKTAAELFEKEAAAIARMPDDDKRWPAQVLSELHKQLPFMSKYDVDIEMTRIEPEAGYALGYAMLRNKTGRTRAEEQLGKATNKLRVPVIVADRLLQPFHVFEIGGKTYPLTQDRVESAMMNPAMFDGASDPPGTQSLLDQIYPPFQHRQGYGMMSGDRATTGLSKLSSAPTKAAGLTSPPTGVSREDWTAGAIDTPVDRGLRAKGHWRIANALSGRGLFSNTQGGVTQDAIGRPTKTASGESGPLREFLRQQEIEKLAVNLVGQAAGQGIGQALRAGTLVRGSKEFGSAVAAARAARAANPGMIASRGQLRTGAVRGVAPIPPGGPNLRVKGAVRGPAAAPPAAPPAVVGNAGAPTQPTNASAPAPAAAPPTVTSTIPSSIPQGGGMPVDISRAAAPPPATTAPAAAAARPIPPAEAPPRSSPFTSSEYDVSTFAERVPRSGPTGGSSARAVAHEEFGEIIRRRMAEEAAGASARAPARFTVQKGRLRARLRNTGRPGSAGEISPSGVAGNAGPVQHPEAHSFAMREMGLPANTTPEQFAMFTAQAEQASARLGRKVTPIEMYRHSIAGTGAGYMDTAARAAGGGLSTLGKGVAIGGLGLGLGGMAIANKAQDRY